MNKRIFKKKVKEKWKLKEIPIGLSVKWVDRYLTEIHLEITRKIREKLEEAVLYGIGDKNEEDANQNRSFTDCM